MAEYGIALEKQAELSQFWLSDQGYEEMWGLYNHLVEHGDGETREIAKESRDGLEGARSIFSIGLQYGECFYWSQNILDIITAASQTIPSHWTLLPQALPSPTGFFWLSKSLPYPLPDWALRAFVWVPVIKKAGHYEALQPPFTDFGDLKKRKDEIAITYFYDMYTARRPIPLHTIWYTIGTTLGEQPALHVDESIPNPFLNSHAQDTSLNIFASMLAFIQQRILVPSRQRPERSTRRRLERENREISEVNVIHLRHLIHKLHKEGEDEPVDWTCQWIVRGHWRDQWYPSIHRNQPIWIAPYLKGPEDKPLRDPRRLFSVVR